MANDDELADGLYESVVTSALLRRLAARTDVVAHIGRVDPADQADVLATHLGRALLQALRAPADSDEPGRLDVVHRVLTMLGAEDDLPEDGVRRLLALTRQAVPAYPKGVRPSTPLVDVALLTNAHGDPSRAATSAGPLAPSTAF